MSTPTVDPEPALPRKRTTARLLGRGGSFVRWFRRLVIVLVLVVLLPVVLTLVYIIPAIHPISTLMAKDLVLFRGYDRQWAALDEIAPVLVNSVVMSEDGQFCFHQGIDWRELNAVIEDALSGETTRGASTIPMQTVKNLFLWQGRSFIRKGLEAPLAIYFDAVTPKRRIMEIYLNVVEWGPGIYGAEAAARHHFGRSASQLSSRQAALLAATLPNPAARNPAKPGRGMSQVANIIERRANRARDYVTCLK